MSEDKTKKENDVVPDPEPVEQKAAEPSEVEEVVTESEVIPKETTETEVVIDEPVTSEINTAEEIITEIPKEKSVEDIMPENKSEVSSSPEIKKENDVTSGPKVTPPKLKRKAEHEQAQDERKDKEERKREFEHEKRQLKKNEKFVQKLLIKARARIQERKRAKLDKIVSLFETQEKVTATDVQKLLRVTKRTVRNYFDQLEEEWVIKQVGRVGRGVFYIKR